MPWPMNGPKVDTQESNSGPYDYEADALLQEDGHHTSKGLNNSQVVFDRIGKIQSGPDAVECGLARGPL